MRRDRGLPQLFEEPWLITESGLRLVLNVASRNELFSEERVRALAARDGAPLDNARSVTVRDGVAIVPVTGPIVRHASLFDNISGACSTEMLARDFTTALEDPAVRAILLDVDSPGGEANGIAELSTDVIAAARGRKPIVAYAGGMCASAAYWIGTAADEVVVHESAWLGSIGAVIAYVDDSEAKRKIGVRTLKFISSIAPLKQADPASEAGAQSIQSRVNQIGLLFAGAVARNRGVTLDKVLSDFGRGDVLMGPAAVAAGMADRLGNFEDTLAALANRVRPRPLSTGARAKMTTTTKTNSGEPRATMGDGECDGCGRAMSADEDTYCEECCSGSGAKAQLGQMIEATGATSFAEALGKLHAYARAAAELSDVRAQMAVASAKQRAADLKSTLTAALAGGPKAKITLGEVARVIPTLLGEAAPAARAALDAIPAPAALTPEQRASGAKVAATWTADAVVTAITSAPISEGALDSVRAFIEARGSASVLPEPVKVATLPSQSARIDAIAAELVAGEEQALDDVAKAAASARRIIDGPAAPAPAR